MSAIASVANSLFAEPEVSGFRGKGSLRREPSESFWTAIVPSQTIVHWSMVSWTKILLMGRRAGQIATTLAVVLKRAKNNTIGAIPTAPTISFIQTFKMTSQSKQPGHSRFEIVLSASSLLPLQRSQTTMTCSGNVRSDGRSDVKLHAENFSSRAGLRRSSQTAKDLT